MTNRFTKASLGALLALALTASFVFAAVPQAFALADGTYVVKRAVDYADPATGEPVDGGDITLGTEMANDIIEQEVLIEQVDGRTFVTMGFNLADQIADARIAVHDKSGKYISTRMTEMGVKEIDDDVRAHLRFEVPSADSLIRPTLDVIPMGRDVTSFVTLDVAAAKAGTGEYEAKLVTADGKPTAEFKALGESEMGLDEVDVFDEGSSLESEDTSTAVQEEVQEEPSKSGGVSPVVWASIAAVAVAAAGIAIALIIKKKK